MRRWPLRFERAAPLALWAAAMVMVLLGLATTALIADIPERGVPLIREPAHTGASAPTVMVGLPFGPLNLQPRNDPSGQRGSGGRARAHYAGGKPATSPAITRRAPDARLFYVDHEFGFEPTLGVNRDGTVFYVAVKSPLRTVVMRSRDDGASWGDVSPQTHRTTQDPYLWIDKGTGRLFVVDFAAGLQVSFSDDEGESWTSSTVPFSWHTDHQNLFAGPPPTGGTEPLGYPHVVYLCSIGGGALGGLGTATTCSRSLDGGISFVLTGEAPFVDGMNEEVGHFGVRGHCGGETGHGFVDRRGDVYLARGWCSQPWLAVSRDEGASWRRVQVADNGMPGPRSDGVQEHEAGVVVDDEGNVYVVWTARNRLPYLAISRDGGKSFGTPMMIGPPGLREASLPSIDIGDTGKIAIAYIGSTNAPGGRAPTGEGPEYEQVTWNGYVTITTQALSGNPVFYTASINKPREPLVKGECPIIRCQQQFDFIDVVVGPDGTAWTSMVDGCIDAQCRELGLAILGHLVGGPTLGSNY
ncbi:MAG: sialidase family protein [Actinomycetota bacterium]